MRTTLLLLLALALAFVACDRNGSTTENGDHDQTKERKGDARDGWQKPEELMALVGNDLGGMTVADLFAEDGYFTFKLIAAGASVIAVVNDPTDAGLIEQQKAEMGIADEQLQIRIVPQGDPGLAPEEVDMALLVHHFVTIQDRSTYFTLLRRALRSPRPLFMVEWQARPTQLGPPPDQRMGTEQVMDALGHLGFTDVGAFSDKMPDQIIYFASDPMEEFDDTMQRINGNGGQ